MIALLACIIVIAIAWFLLRIQSSDGPPPAPIGTSESTIPNPTAAAPAATRVTQDVFNLAEESSRSHLAGTAANKAPGDADSSADSAQETLSALGALTRQDLVALNRIVRTRRSDTDYRQELLATAYEFAERRRFVEAIQVARIFPPTEPDAAELRAKLRAWDQLAWQEQRTLDRRGEYGFRRGLFECWVGEGRDSSVVDQCVRLSALVILRDNYAALGTHERDLYLEGVKYALSNLVKTGTTNPGRRAYMLSMIMDLACEVELNGDAADTLIAHANLRIPWFISGGKRIVAGQDWQYFDGHDSRKTTVPLVAFERLSQHYALSTALVQQVAKLLDTIEAQIGPLESKEYDSFSTY